jgi:hypothetical protein
MLECFNAVHIHFSVLGVALCWKDENVWTIGGPTASFFRTEETANSSSEVLLIKMDIKEVGWEGLDCIKISQVRDQKPTL